MMASTIYVDYSALVDDQLILSSTQQADGQVSVGLLVTAVDRAEDEMFSARVERVDSDGSVRLRVDWENPQQQPLSNLRASASVRTVSVSSILSLSRNVGRSDSDAGVSSARRSKGRSLTTGNVVWV